MMYGVSNGRWFLLPCLVLCFSAVASGDNATPGKSSPPPEKSSPPPVEPPSPSPEPCVIKPDYSSTEGELRTAIFAADTKLAAKILGRNQTFGLGEGLRYLPEQRCAIVRTDNPRRDPDIVAYQAVALSAKATGETQKLANAIVVSFELECECSLFNSTERDRMAGAFKQILEDPKKIEAILAFGGPDYEPEAPNGARRRRLLSHPSSPTNSFKCAGCDPPAGCDGAVNWCPDS